MLNRWFRRAEKLPTPSDEELLANLLVAPLFKRNMMAVAEHTRRGYEGGYAAYRRGGSVALSQVLLPEPDWWVFTHWRKDWHPSTNFPGHMLYGKFEPTWPRDAEEEWIQRQDPARSPKRRKDVFFFLHSHPNGNVTPSKVDIGSWSDTERANPHCVYATVGTRRTNPTVLLWRRQVNTPYNPPSIHHNGFENVEVDRYIALYDYVEPFRLEQFLDLAPHLGVNALAATYNIGRNRLYPAASSIAEKLAA